MTTNKYLMAIESLNLTGKARMTCFGNSMTPILHTGSTLTFQKQDTYEIGDIVFCKVKGRFIDAHKIIKIDQNKGYLIANNHGHENGWTRQVYAKAIHAEERSGKSFDL